MPFNLGAPELIVVLVVVLVIFGPGKLPSIGQSLGKGIREFRRAQSSFSLDDEPKPKAATEPIAADSVPATKEETASRTS